MKRSLTSLTLMGCVFGLSSATFGQNVSELRTFFTDLGSGFSMLNLDSNSDGKVDGPIPTLGVLPTTNPVVDLQPGQMTVLGIWMSPVRGNNTIDFNVTSGGLSILGQIGNALLRTGVQWYSSAAMRDPGATPGNFTGPSVGVGAGASNMPAGDNPFRLMNPYGWAGATGLKTNPGTGDLPLDGAAFFLGAIKIMVPATAVAGTDKLNVWLATSGSATKTWQSVPTLAGTSFTMGFGFDAGGVSEFRRYDSTAQINAAATGELASLTADAMIRVVPEPASLALLSLGLLGLRRRRTA